MKRPASPLTVILAAVAVLVLNGCGATPIERWETSMAVYVASTNTVAAALDEGKISVEDARTYREAARVARAALDAWLLTISPDGRTDSGAARAAAEAALGEARRLILHLLSRA